MSAKKSEIAVTIHCAHDALVKLDALHPHPRNVNRHPPEQIEFLARIIAATGWRHPVIVSRRSGFIVAGHGRLLAAQQAGLDVVPVNMQEFESEAEELEFLIADNRLQELAELDGDALRRILQDTPDLDPALAGFDPDALRALLEVDEAGDLAADIAGIEEYTPTAEAERAAEKVRERIDSLLEQMPSAFTGQAVILSDSTNAALVISDPGLKDFLDELKRYAAAGDPSPLNRILEAVHPL